MNLLSNRSGFLREKNILSSHSNGSSGHSNNSSGHSNVSSTYLKVSSINNSRSSTNNSPICARKCFSRPISCSYRAIRSLHRPRKCSDDAWETQFNARAGGRRSCGSRGRRCGRSCTFRRGVSGGACRCDPRGPRRVRCGGRRCSWW